MGVMHPPKENNLVLGLTSGMNNVSQIYHNKIMLALMFLTSYLSLQEYVP